MQILEQKQLQAICLAILKLLIIQKQKSIKRIITAKKFKL